MARDDDTPARVRWARLRFSIIGPLLAVAARRRRAQARIDGARRAFVATPDDGRVACASRSRRSSAGTTRRAAQADPIRALAAQSPETRRHPPERVGRARRGRSAQQHQDHPRWSYQLHYDNLVALAPRGSAPRADARLRDGLPVHEGPRPLSRPQRSVAKHDDDASCRARHAPTRSSTSTASGTSTSTRARAASSPPRASGKKPQLLGILDDRSRLCCHLQWYLEETAECLVHGLSQAIPEARPAARAPHRQRRRDDRRRDRRGPRAARHRPSHDAAVLARAERQAGVVLGASRGPPPAHARGRAGAHPRAPQPATQAWVEQEYHRKVHSEIDETPLERYLRGPSVGRDSPSSDALRRAFRMRGHAQAAPQRRHRHRRGRSLRGPLRVPHARASCAFASRAGTSRASTSSTRARARTSPRSCRSTRRATPSACRPRRRRRRAHASRAAPAGIAPLLRALMAEYAATGLPPAYVPNATTHDSDDDTTAEDA